MLFVWQKLQAAYEELLPLEKDYISDFVEECKGRIISVTFLFSPTHNFLWD